MSRSALEPLFEDIQEVFEPFGCVFLVDEKKLDIKDEINAINKEIDEALEFYFSGYEEEDCSFPWKQ